LVSGVFEVIEIEYFGFVPDAGLFGLCHKPTRHPSANGLTDSTEDSTMQKTV